MKRRSLLKSVPVLPVAGVLAPFAAAQTTPPPKQETQAPAAAADNMKIPLAPPRSAGTPVTGFFTAAQFSALKKLGDILVPPFNDRPGATDCGAAEFLDFYVSKRSAAGQKLYQSGLDRLNTAARAAHGKAFSDLTAEQAAPILKPMTLPWTYAGPQDPFGRFLLSAKEDLLRATTNSREYATALSATSRTAGGVGYYWYPVE